MRYPEPSSNFTTSEEKIPDGHNNEYYIREIAISRIPQYTADIRGGHSRVQYYAVQFGLLEESVNLKQTCIV